MRVHQRFRLAELWYDPYQAALLAQNLRRRSINAKPMVFSGRNLDAMASSLLELLNSRSVSLFDDSELVRQLSTLNLCEKSYGVRVEAPRDKSGHGDKVTSVLLVLPAILQLMHAKARVPTPPSFTARPRDPARHGVQLDLGPSRPRLFHG
jgi:hypothetical protein